MGLSLSGGSAQRGGSVEGVGVGGALAYEAFLQAGLGGVVQERGAN